MKQVGDGLWLASDGGLKPFRPSYGSIPSFGPSDLAQNVAGLGPERASGSSQNPSNSACLQREPYLSKDKIFWLAAQTGIGLAPLSELHLKDAEFTPADLPDAELLPRLFSKDEDRHVSVLCPTPSEATRLRIEARSHLKSAFDRFRLVTPDQLRVIRSTLSLAHQQPLSVQRALTDQEARIAADLLGLTYIELEGLDLPVNALLQQQPVDPTQFGHISRIRLAGQSAALFAPSSATLISTARQLLVNPAIRSQLKVTSVSALREAARRPYRQSFSVKAQAGLLKGPEHLSAKTVTVRRRPKLVFAVAFAAMCVVFFSPLALHVVTLLALLCVSVLRAGALSRLLPKAHAIDVEPSTERLALNLPAYTILVPLRREVSVLGRLIRNLQALDYPADKLQILLIIEQDDQPMRMALEGFILPPHFDVLVVPPSRPQNKPKALNFAVQHATGQLVTIYDAEDRPTPDQLTKAAQIFAQQGRDLACVQAELAVDHGRENWITKQFSLEYAVLFGGVLPFLSQLKLAFPLGGTSNHFRKSALLQLGAWDAFNVTEDADLAFRLARQGWRMQSLNSITWEEAPLSLDAWMGQRRRWFKGWLQTLIVHLSSPVTLVRSAGLGNSISLLTMLAGGLIALALHPLFLISFIWTLVTGQPLLHTSGGWQDLLLALDFVFLTFGYVIAIGAGWVAARHRLESGRLFVVITMPFYWLMMSVALYRAIWDLIHDPHGWIKTEHGRARLRP